MTSSSAQAVPRRRARPVRTLRPERRAELLELPPAQTDLVPEELLVSLASTLRTSDQLGPVHHKHSKGSGVRRPDTVWHHAHGRHKYKHFLEQPPSLRGAGRDISFLCDAMATQRRRKSLPPLSEQGNDCMKQRGGLVESLIPAEYHLVRNRGLKSLALYDNKFTVQLMDDDQRFRVFPSLKPSGRQEAVQLMTVMDDMLEKAGVKQHSDQLTDLCQMQGLVELLQVEQNIYNIVFHEVIRQVSVECAERGALLAKLRQQYMALLDRIPRQLKNLHAEGLAQRALDRRLTEEIIHLKHFIQQLNTKLSEIRDHNDFVSVKAGQVQEQLVRSVDQAQKNTQLVQEYHQLYEMQRHRLEAQVGRLTNERDLWKKVTYSLTLKVISLKKLQLVNRLHISEKTWTKTAEHLTVLLSAQDSEDLSEIMQLMDQWKDQLTAFMSQLRETERAQCEQICSIQAGVAKWLSVCSSGSRSLDTNYQTFSEEDIHADLKEWSNTLTIQCERYGGEELLSCHETLSALRSLQKSWAEVGLQLFRRHLTAGGEPPGGQEAMQKLGRAVSELHQQLDTRVSGESGIHKRIMALVRPMDSWVNKLRTVIGRPGSMLVSDWLKLERDLQGWQNLTEDVLQNISNSQLEKEKIKNRKHNKIAMEDVFDTMREFNSSQSNFFDSENTRIREEVSSINTALTCWMVDLLFLLVPNHSEDQEQVLLEGPGPEHLLTELSVEKLEEDARTLSQTLDRFSKSITSSCQLILEEQIQKQQREDATDSTVHQNNMLQRMCADWVESCLLLLSELKGSPVELSVNQPGPVSSPDIPPSTQPGAPSIPPSQTTCVESVVEVKVTAEPDEEEEIRDETLTEHSEGKLVGQEEEEEEEEKEEEAGSQAGPVMELIGYDGHITEKTLGESRVQLEGTKELVVSPSTEHAQTAFDMLTNVVVLQRELQAAEAQIQNAEDRALKAEEALQGALVQIQDLKRRLRGRPSPEPKGSAI
ncbi:axonemal dynein light chain domain-containing protein 1 [Lampris incognitus]|uniref:axonemal dynein light chain domain-containing protein 1 n=1 Tax=Lampris incognitus TaxID=2546036 RepID=UPI0024B55D07|nr:axonemal dynein light chain domain-containing protein 1 [Lampris incognitus]